MLRLKTPSDPKWLACVLADMDAVLVDHAHCEQKAATTALAFATKYPDDPQLVIQLAALAAEEAQHFEQMVRECEKRGLALGFPAKDVYVRGLLQDLSAGVIEHRVDRLLVCAIVEARSCERLKLIAEHLQDPELQPLYDALWRAEAGHHTLFVDLAVRSLERGKGLSAQEAQRQVRERLDALCAKEAQVLARVPIRPAIH